MIAKMTTREKEIHLDLEKTRLLYKAAQSKTTKESINNLRYLLIVELHSITYGNIKDN